MRVGHKVDRAAASCVGNYNSTDEPTINNVRIDAAILSLQHSFIVDNYNCGRLGTLTVNGAIAQKYRGPVGTGSGGTLATGFLKNYWYDDRLRYRSPPYFLTRSTPPGTSSRSHEQVPRAANEPPGVPIRRSSLDEDQRVGCLASPPASRSAPARPSSSCFDAQVAERDAVRLARPRR